MPLVIPYRTRSGRSVNQPEEGVDERKKRIRVLLVNWKGQETVHTLQVPVNFKDTDVPDKIFSEPKVLKDTVGYQMEEESMIRVSVAHSSLLTKKLYVLEVTSPMLRAQVQMTRATDLPYEYIIKMLSPMVKSLEFDKYSNLLNCRRFSDVTLCVEGRNIFAHKLILANKSPVFDAMFTKKVKKVEINDTTYDSFLDMLQYIYNGYIVDGVTDNAFHKYSNLIKTDDIYCVGNLKEVCEVKLSLVLSTENVLHSLVLADLHNAFILKQKAIDFIVDNTKKIIAMPSYASFAKENPDLVAIILKNVVLKTGNSR